MTPPISECPASSELPASSSRSQGISGGGVRNGALLAPLRSYCGKSVNIGGVRDHLINVPRIGEKRVSVPFNLA